MRRTVRWMGAALAACLVSGCVTTGTAPAGSRNAAAAGRFGMITGLAPDKAEQYRELHAAPWPGVLKQLARSNIRNYSIYLKELDGKPYLFSYFEYVGTDFEADMAAMAADPTTQLWWKETDPCQVPLPAAAAKKQIWDGMEEVYHFDGAVDVEPAQVARYGTVTGLKPEKEAWYRLLHASPWPAINAQIKACNIRSYSIYLKEIGGKLYLLSYFEYVGDDFEADMAKMADDPVTKRWWAQTDPCQLPLPDAAAKKEIWSAMEEVFHTD